MKISENYINSKKHIKTKSYITLVKSSLLSLVICFCGTVLANDKLELDQAFSKFSKHIKAGELKVGLPYGQKVYQLSQKLFDDSHPSRIAAAENYGFILKQLGKSSEAEVVFLDLLKQKENKFGHYAKELITVLADLSELALTEDTTTRYRQRYEKLYLRHHSSEFVSQLTSTNLKTDPFAGEVKARLIKRLDADIKVHETPHWTLLMVGSSNKYATETGEMLEKIYKSMLSFRIALDIPPPKLKQKMVAVYFETFEQNRSFNRQKIKKYKSGMVDVASSYSNRQVFLSRSTSISMPKWYPSAYLPLNLSKKADAPPQWQVIQATGRYITWNSGLARKTQGKSPWLYWALFSSFFHSDSSKEFGPHTDNYASGSIEQIKKTIAKHSAPSVRIIVAPTDSWRQEGKRTTQFDPVLLRYMYTYYPEQLAKFFIDSSSMNTNGKNPTLRARFEDAFGDIEQHEAPFSKFLQALIKDADIKLKT